MDTVVNRLIRGAIQTGLFITTFSVGALVTGTILPSSTLQCLFGIPIGRIYTNVRVFA